MEKLPRNATLVLATLVLAATLVACGGDGDSVGDGPGSQASPAAPADRGDSRTPSGRSQQDSPEEASKEGAEAEEVGPLPSPEAAADRDSGGGSERFQAPSGDNSIQEFGEEAGASERRDAAVVLHAFLQAQARQRWAAACSYLSESVLEQLRVLATRLEGPEPKDCPETFAKLTPPLAASARRELAEADVGSLRIEGDRAFVLYEGARGNAFTINMVQEDDEWKVAALAPLPLP